MNISSIFDEKPEQWGLRGDPYFWEYLREKCVEKGVDTPEKLEALVKEEFKALTGEEFNGIDMVKIERFAHGGMSSGGVDENWWAETGIPLLKSRF